MGRGAEAAAVAAVDLALYWFILVYTSVHWFILVLGYPGFKKKWRRRVQRVNLSFSLPLYKVSIRSVSYVACSPPPPLLLELAWCILVYTGLYWFILVYTDLYWFILVYTGLYWFGLPRFQ